MYRQILPKLGFCLGVLSLCLYSYQQRQNELTHLKIQVPEREAVLRAICEENSRLLYEIERLESPQRLIELAHCPEFGHLKHPLMKEVFRAPEGVALNDPVQDSRELW